METSRTRLCITGQVELLTVVPRSLDGEPNSPRRSVNGAKNPYPIGIWHGGATNWGSQIYVTPALCPMHCAFYYAQVMPSIIDATLRAID